MKKYFFLILLGWCVASGASADHKFKKQSPNLPLIMYPGTNIIGDPLRFDLRKGAGIWTFTNQSSIAHSSESIRKQNNIREAQVERLNSAVKREWNHMRGEQFVTRMTARMFLFSGALLGVCSEEFENAYSDETWAFTFEPYSELSDEELRKELIEVNKDISTIRESILTDMFASDSANKIKELNIKVMDGWKSLLNDSDVREKGIDRLLMQYQSWDDYMRNLIVGEENCERIKWYFETPDGGANFIKFENRVWEFTQAGGEILLNNMDQYEGRLNQLQDLSENSLKIRALIGVRSYYNRKESETHSHGGENCHAEETKGQQQGQ